MGINYPAMARAATTSDVFNAIDRDTRQPVQNPLELAMQRGTTTHLQANTSLIRRDGVESPIEDSAALIHDDFLSDRVHHCTIAPRDGHSNQNPRSAISTALSIALALSSVSSYSISGTESATMPAPTCTSYAPLCQTIVRRAMQVSMFPAKSR